MESSERGPGVAFPPPFVFVVGFGLGWLLGRFVPLFQNMVPHAAVEMVGAILAGAGLAGLMWAMSTFVTSGTSIVPIKRASTLVTHGPYRYSRNPMYASLTLAYAGLALTTETWWALILLPLVLFVLYRAVIAREERYLHSEFGDAYRDYTRRVRRWI